MKSRKNILLMLGIVFLQGFVFYGPISTLYRESRGISLYQIFLIESISWILMLLLEVPWGHFSDRFGYKKTLIVVNGVFFVSKIVFFTADSFNGFLLERIMLSVVFAGFSGCDAALLHASAGEEQLDKVFGQYSAAGTAGFLLASVMSSFMITSPLDASSIDRTGFYTIFPYALAFILSWFLKEMPQESCTETPRLRDSIRKAFKLPSILGLVIAVSLAREIFQAVTVFLNQGQYLKSGIDVRWFGILLVLMQGGKLLAARSHLISRRFGGKKSASAMLIFITLSCLLLYYTQSPWLSIIGIFTLSVSMSILEPIAMSMENKALDNIDRATVLSVYAMIGEIFAAGINPLIGNAANGSLQGALLFCAGLGVAAIGIFSISSISKG